MAGTKRSASPSDDLPRDDHYPSDLSLGPPAAKRQRTRTSSGSSFLQRGGLLLKTSIGRALSSLRLPFSNRTQLGQPHAALLNGNGDGNGAPQPTWTATSVVRDASAEDHPELSAGSSGSSKLLATPNGLGETYGPSSPIDLTRVDDDDENENDHPRDGYISRSASLSPGFSSSEAGPSRSRRIPPQSIYPALPDLLPSDPSLASPSDTPDHLFSPHSPVISSRPGLKRPDVRHYQRPGRSYDWSQPSQPSQPFQSSQYRGRPSSSQALRTPGSPRKRGQAPRAEEMRRNAITRAVEGVMANGNDGEGPEARRSARVSKMFSLAKDTKAPEKQFKKLAQTLNPRDAFASLLATRAPKTLEEALKPTTEAFAPEVKFRTGDRARRKVAQQKTTSSVEDILARLKLEEKAKEEAIQARLRPRVPESLTKDQDAVGLLHMLISTSQVNAALKNPAFSARLASEIVPHGSLTRLRGTEWLNDEVINFYGALLLQRANTNLANDGTPKVKLHVFSSYFYTKVASPQGHSAVKRWTKKVDLFDQDMFVFPINVQGLHWTAGVVDLRKKRIEYYDSMGDFGGIKDRYFDVVRKYLDAEHTVKKGKPFDFEGWEDAFNSDSPQQDNGSDCGIFTCQTLEARARGLDLIDGEFEFTSRNMPFFRRLMMWEIAKGELAKRW
ncbi:Smt3-specific protease [Saitozyma podzolica]|uniref:Smt3-specific protease n=1 Tax=Saitozyma podzolica TaxID=1890683 RepID=A0A427YEC4_9TREE|nr:Smt3-specific protease [Saitozyma podzolica]